MSNNLKTSEVRFGFGKNWSNFLIHLNEDRIHEAVVSLQQKLGINDLKGKTFLDVGSGSGLFSLAAYRLGAMVHSFDYDQDSVNCTQYLKDTYAKDSDNWSVQQGSVLDKEFLNQFGQVDILYSWGVLHHTGNMYQAFENVSDMVRNGGRLFISIYNDQGGASKRWFWIKKTYCNSGFFVRQLLSFYTLFRQWTLTFVRDFIKSANPFKTWFQYAHDRGMSPWHDVVDWVGGYPFEVAKPEDVLSFFSKKNYNLIFLKTHAGGLGCNEFVFIKNVN